MNLRTQFGVADIPRLVELHRRVYAVEFGWDASFLEYVESPLSEFAKFPSPRSKIWLAERDNAILGSIAIVEFDQTTAQLRWFVVAPETRHQGLGSRLLCEAISFSHVMKYQSVFLWTEASLTSAARLYQSAGFRKTDELAGMKWGVSIVEERWQFVFGDDYAAFGA